MAHTLQNNKGGLQRFLNRGVILTRDNLARRNWQGSKTYAFCQHDESITYLFFECKFARAVWAIVQVASNLYPLAVCIICLAIGCRVLTNNFLHTFLWERQPYVVLCGLPGMMWFLTKNVFHLLCSLFMHVRDGFVLGLSYRGRRTETFL